MEATKFLKQQHEEVRALLKDYEKLEEGEQGEKLRLFREIKKNLEIHAKIEEEIFYPPIRRARSKEAREEVMEAYEEHHLIKTVLQELSSVEPSREEVFDAKMKVLGENVEHHASEEEDEMFPDARKIFSKQELEDYGERLEARAAELKANYASAVAR